MKKADAKLIVSAIARAIKQNFTKKEDHTALVQRVENLEAALAEIRKHQEAA